jgi:hypothetical protein
LPALIAFWHAVANGSIEHASRSGRVHQTHYFWMQEDSSYPRRFKDAEVQAARSLEDEAIRRAREGISKPGRYGS